MVVVVVVVGTMRGVWGMVIVVIVHISSVMDRVLLVREESGWVVW